MKLPGEAVLEFEIEPDSEQPDRCQLTQTARFKPKGLLGLVYGTWCCHYMGLCSAGMLGGIRKTAEQIHRDVDVTANETTVEKTA
jgi:hypothetical protein